MQIKKIIKDYTPNSKTLLTPEAQAKTIQDLYDQVREFFIYFNSSEFIQIVKGEKGDPGAEGARGEKGLKGDKGEQGVVGPIGPRGPKGDTGADGIPGPKGDKGDIGPRGEIGPIGPRGPQGSDGAPGADGKPGEKGDIGASFGLIDVQNTYSDIVKNSPRVNAGFYLVASKNKENGDVYVYREKYDDFVFLNNIMYDLFFQLMQAPPGKNFLNLIKGANADKYGNITIDKEETIDSKGYLHTKFTLNFLKGNGIANSEWTENKEDDKWSTLVITYDNGETDTVRVKNGKTGPQGIQGEVGPIGPKGDTGPQGPQGEKGEKGDTGPQGIPGKSSYQLAVDEGYKGTLEEFLNLIKEIYIGVGSTYSDIFINDNKYENIKSPRTFNITVNNNKIIVIYPNTNFYVSTPKLNGIDIPFINSTFIDDDIQYNVFTSINNYNGNLIITI